MINGKDLIFGAESRLKKLTLSRRAFMKASSAIIGSAVVIGCEKSSGEPIFLDGDGNGGGETTDPTNYERFYGSGTHNCGGRCVSVAEVSNGRIARILTDENTHTSDGTYLDKESRNFPQTRVCSRCRAYRYRLYHPGRLLYPLKQTKKRGDLSGFVRITWDKALKELATKHKNVIDEYGVDGIYSLYATGSDAGNLQGASGGPLGTGNTGDERGVALRYMGGAQNRYFGSYSAHQWQYLADKYVGIDGTNTNSNSIAKHTKNIVLWGDNAMSTRNNNAMVYVKGIQDMKERDPDAKVYYVGPYFSDGGVTLADEWLVSKPYTDPALVAGMVYHMLDNTFDLTTGELKPDAWLDVDYLDTLVYGFFDSPAYSITELTGVIDATGDRDVPAVPTGKSYCSWVLGNNTKAKTYADTATNYTAKQLTTIDNNFKRWASCSYDASASTIYKTKQDFKKPKTPEWASAITGIPADAIKRLAEVYAKGGPIASTWSGGMQKQADGVISLFAVEALHVITKNVGTTGAGFFWYIGANVVADPKALKVTVPRTYTLGGTVVHNDKKASASCTAWHTAIKMAYADELKAGGYDAKYIPNFKQGTKKTSNVYWDDAGTKTFIQWRRDTEGKIKTYTDVAGDIFFDWEGRTGTTGNANAHDGTPVYSGIRLMYNSGGNIFINQHENSNDSRQMLESLKLNNYADADTFCLMSFDNFMSATPRWSDYVLPATTSWEQQNIITPRSGSSFYTPQVSTPPGESKPAWDFANELLKAYEKIDTSAAGAAIDFTGGKANQTVEAIVKKEFNKGTVDVDSPYFGMSWNDYLKNPYLPAKPNDDTLPPLLHKFVMDNYKGLTSSDKADKPFITTTNKVATNEVATGGYGNEFSNIDTAPKSAWRFQVYSPVLVWQYENKFSKYHGYLPVAQRGQQHTDIEGNKFVLEIPLYYAYQDYFMEAYGGEDKIADLPFVMTTTHSRYRSHSSFAENPLLRELSHRVPGRGANGKFKPANDYNNYSMSPKAFTVNKVGEYPELSETIKADGTVDAANKDIASYNEIFMNEADAKDSGILDGDLVEISNPIGIVRCVARLTARCSRGFVDLHQGSWYDPREINGKTVDVGGNANTLMASQPSRVDHGNGQQSAMVKIIKVNY